MQKLDTPGLRRSLAAGAIERLEIRRVCGGRYALRVRWREGFGGPGWLHLQRLGVDGKPQRSERASLDGWRYAIGRLQVPDDVPVVYPTGNGGGDGAT